MTRPRRKRRELERELRKVVRENEKRAGEMPGGSPAQPIDVASAAIVEVKARATPCIQCAGGLDLRADHATSTARGVLREIELVCRHCHAPRTLWFRVPLRAPN